jgi:hypothetical protein
MISYNCKSYSDRENCLPLDYETLPGSFKKRKWPIITPDMHQKIKRLYRNKTENSGEVKEFARRHGLPRWKITRYAQNNGWIPKQKKEPDWSENELKILRENAHKTPEFIARHLRKKGFKRSLVGISVKRKRMRYLQNLKGQSARSLALCLGEDDHFVTNAIRKGLLKAEKRGTKRTER